MSRNLEGRQVSDVDIIEFHQMPEPAVSPLNRARLYFDETSKTIRVSLDNGAYADLGSGGGGGGGTPGGSNTQVQFNDSGSFGGNANFTFNKTLKSLYIGSVACILPGTITRVSDQISTVALTGGRTLTISRDGNGRISSVADGGKTWTFTRNGDQRITSWAVA